MGVVNDGETPEKGESSLKGSAAQESIFRHENSKNLSSLEKGIEGVEDLHKRRNSRLEKASKGRYAQQGKGYYVSEEVQLEPKKATKSNTAQCEISSHDSCKANTLMWLDQEETPHNIMGPSTTADPIFPSPST